MKWKLAIGLVLCVFLLAACSTKELSISTRTLTEDERILVKNSGGADMEYFVIKGTMPEGHTLGISIEVYEKGELISENEPGLFKEDLGDRNIGFGVQPGWEDQFDELIFGSPGGLLRLNLEPIGGASSHNSFIDEKVALQPGEPPVYLAYWIASEDGRIRGFGHSLTEDDLEELKAYDRAILLKAELREE
ncbi:hypothetical protein AB1K83_17365 [Sporosarcina sp. 179-K 3D1 HS]|uniref:hypothetical protein n=1 Tax=Sporosarcina sp. 179-K 3D1 HS TaxID=3232169 RepID=UPI0039A2275F